GFVRRSEPGCAVDGDGGAAKGESDLGLRPLRELLQTPGELLQRTRRQLLTQCKASCFQRVLIVAVADEEQRRRERALGSIVEHVGRRQFDLESERLERTIGDGGERS